MRTVILIAFALATLPSHAQTPAAPSVWDTTRLHYLQQPITKLNPPDRHEILKRLQIPASQLRGEEVTLDGDRTFLVQATGGNFCGASGNCSFWIFDSNHKILLDSIAQQMTYLPQRHAGRKDVLTSMHGSATSGQLKHWQFDGKIYRPTGCATYNYQPDPDGEPLIQPRITQVPCTPP